MNRLGELLNMKPRDRNVDHYEAVFDDLVASMGGVRIAERCAIPENSLNADYLVERPDCEIVIELKQLHKYDKDQSVDEFFRSLLRQGRIRTFRTLGATQIEIVPESLDRVDWSKFYGKFRPNVVEHLDKAARQIKATQAFLPPTAKRRIGGVVIVNTGDYHVSVDLLARFVEFRLKRMWRAGKYSSIDFAMCFALDMVKEGQHPFHAPAICRSVEDATVASNARFLFDRWIRYGASAVGAEVVFDPTAAAMPHQRQVSGGMTGKVRRVQ